MTRYELMKSMHNVICAMNNEEAYFRWVYIVPDCPTDEDLQDIAEDDEEFEEVCMFFRELVAEYSPDGFYVGRKTFGAD